MPVNCNANIQRIGQTVFKQIDNEVMGHAFAVHTELGQLFDEQLYANRLALKLQNAGYKTDKEDASDSRTILYLSR